MKNLSKISYVFQSLGQWFSTPTEKLGTICVCRSGKGAATVLQRLQVTDARGGGATTYLGGSTGLQQNSEGLQPPLISSV